MSGYGLKVESDRMEISLRCTNISDERNHLKGNELDTLPPLLQVKDPDLDRSLRG